jgi:sugar-specific transcriptional regulator TrmB
MSKNLDLNIVTDLALLGIDEKSARVYSALLKGGELSAISLSKELELHRQFVYNSLASLKEKGLVIEVDGVRAKWRAQHPRTLIAMAEEQELRAKRVAELLVTMKGERAGQEFSVTEGVKGFQQRIIETIRKTPHNSTIRMICGQWDTYFKLAGEHAHAQWDQIRIAKGIMFRIIGPLSLAKSLDIAKTTRALTEYRILSGLDTSLVNTVIYDDAVDFDIYGNPHLTFSIKNKEVAESQRKFFETLWDGVSGIKQ